MFDVSEIKGDLLKIAGSGRCLRNKGGVLFVSPLSLQR